MQPKNANIDYCGIRNLLRLLVGRDSLRQS